MSPASRLGAVPVFWTGMHAPQLLSDGMQTCELRPARFYGHRAHPGDRPAAPAPVALDAPRAAVRAHDRAAAFLAVTAAAPRASRRERRAKARAEVKAR